MDTTKNNIREKEMSKEEIFEKLESNLKYYKTLKNQLESDLVPPELVQSHLSTIEKVKMRTRHLYSLIKQ